MIQKFNKVTTYSNFIKYLLATTYLPLIRSVRSGDYICKDRLYVLECEIIKCTSSGYIGNSQYLGNKPIARWRRIGEYHFGEKDGKLSTCYISNSEGYDFKTHERLGQYLRNLRDMYGLNLMPLYNCFSNQFLDNHVIKNNKIIKTMYTNNTKLYKIPVRFNQDYTVCIENVGVTKFAPAFIRYNTLLKQNNTMYGNGVDVTNQYISLHAGDKIKTYSNLSFNKPVKIRFDNKPEYKKYNIYRFPGNKPAYIITEDVDVDLEKTYYRKSSMTNYIKLDFPYREANLNYEAYEQGFDSEITYYEKKNGEYIITQDTIPDEDKQYYIYSMEIHPYEKIEINSDTGFETMFTYYEKLNDEYVVTEDTEPVSGKQYYIKDNESYYELAPAIRLENAIVAQYEITDEMCAQFDEVEDHLYLLIEVPKTFNQNIVVLEGDYTRLEAQKIVDYTVINELPDFLYDDFYTHDLNLMTGTSTEPRPFSPVLVEFLLWNAISCLDTINNNFDRLSIEMFKKYIPNTDDLGEYPNFWVDRYRQIISDFINYNSKNVIQDNLGYVTKAVEKYIYKEERWQ